MPAAWKPETEWITCTEAAEILGVSLDIACRLVRRGVLTSRRYPGVHPKVDRASVYALIEASIVPARLPGVPEAETEAASSSR